ncbi:MAG: M1 family metallopeptidase [Chitinophagales bacterium]
MLISIKCFNQNIYIPLNVQHAIDKGTRTMSGTPGKNYWQNSAAYDLKIKFNPKTRILEGNETITYFNNSPDTLDRLIIQIFPDFYKTGTFREYEIDRVDENEGVTIKSISIDNSTDIQGYHDQTNYIALPPKFIDPHSKSIVKIEWTYKVNAGSPVRTGQVDPTTFFMAYSFPRIAVYDDIDGWNYHAYNGLQEFYNDFGDFNAEISVPMNYVVWATGDLQNPDEVFTKKIQGNLNKVMQSDEIIYIINKSDAEEKNVTAKNKWNTFKFKAENVTDFAFALSDHYVWQASSLVVDNSSNRRVRADAVYNPIHSGYDKVAEIAHKSISIMSFKFPQVPFPYSHETIFDGLDQMEYPMMVNDNPTETYKDDVELTVHEIFHTYFPFYMGINETKYAWMDEGWATFGEHIIAKEIIHDAEDEVFLKSLYQYIEGTDNDLPIIINSTFLSGNTYWSNAYGKAALTYLYLKEMLGDDLFLKALHKYMADWQGKHPTPYDYFYAINSGSGKNLDWFWNAWYCQPGYVDQAILNLTSNGDKKYTIVTASLGNKPTPIDITIKFADNTFKNFHAHAGVWEGNNIYYFNFTSDVTPVEAKLNNLNIPDINPDNDAWIK